MSIYNTAVNKPISTLMVFIAIMVLGVASYIQLPVDQYPKMDPPYLTVMATYPGANASDIEENVTKILEDQLNSVDNLKEMTSTSYDNLGVISLEFDAKFAGRYRPTDHNAFQHVYDADPDLCRHGRPILSRYRQDSG